MTPLEVGLPLARYRIDAVTNEEPSPPTEQSGLPSLGPHYLHPALLGQNPILTIPELGLSFQAAGGGPNGGALVVVNANGVPFESLEIDPQSGAVIEQRISLAGMVMTVYRRLP